VRLVGAFSDWGVFVVGFEVLFWKLGKATLQVFLTVFCPSHPWNFKFNFLAGDLNFLRKYGFF
jgi:hypothetical protein